MVDYVICINETIRGNYFYQNENNCNDIFMRTTLGERDKTIKDTEILAWLVMVAIRENSRR